MNVEAVTTDGSAVHICNMEGSHEDLANFEANLPQVRYSAEQTTRFGKVFGLFIIVVLYSREFHIISSKMYDIKTG